MLPKVCIWLAICCMLYVSVGHNLFAKRKGELERPSFPTNFKGKISHGETKKIINFSFIQCFPNQLMTS